MKYRDLGNTGLKVSEIGMACFPTTRENVFSAVPVRQDAPSKFPLWKI